MTGTLHTGVTAHAVILSAVWDINGHGGTMTDTLHTGVTTHAVTLSAREDINGHGGTMTGTGRENGGRYALKISADCLIVSIQFKFLTEIQSSCFRIVGE